MRSDVIIVGAPRSGTNLLRDLISALPGTTTWPCDEINLVWKHHHRDIGHDELAAEDADARSARYLHGVFDAQARRGGAATVVEKTCATSLRLGYVARLFPDARYVLIGRHGLDAAASAMQRWDAPFEARYVARKVRFAPPGDLPFYAGQFAAKRLASLRARRGGAADDGRRLVRSWWGPRPHDYRELSEQHPLDELAVLQWRRCVTRTEDDLAALDPAQVHRLTYEDLVGDPRSTLRGVARFLGRSPADLAGVDLGGISSASVGRGRALFTAEDRERLAPLAAPALGAWGYS